MTRSRKSWILRMIACLPLSIAGGQVAPQPEVGVAAILKDATRLVRSSRTPDVTKEATKEAVPLLASLWADASDPAGALAAAADFLPMAAKISDGLERAEVQDDVARLQYAAGDKAGSLATLDKARKSASGVFVLRGSFWETWGSEMPWPPAKLYRSAEKEEILQFVQGHRAAVENGGAWSPRPSHARHRDAATPPEVTMKTAQADLLAADQEADPLVKARKWGKLAETAYTRKYAALSRSLNERALAMAVSPDGLPPLCLMYLGQILAFTGEVSKSAEMYRRAEGAYGEAASDARCDLLADLSVSQARAGLATDARRTAQTMASLRLANPKLERCNWPALRNIATEQIRMAYLAEALETSRLLTEAFDKVSLSCAIAEAAVAAGDSSLASASYDLARSAASQTGRKGDPSRSGLFLILAFSLARTERVEDAQKAAGEILSPIERGHVMRLDAYAAARQGQARQALAWPESDPVAKAYGLIGVAEAMLHRPSPPGR